MIALKRELNTRNTSMLMIAACLCISAGGVLADCGFSGSVFTLGAKAKIFLNRKKPPQVYLFDTKISVIAHAQTDKARSYTTQLATQLESELINHDPRLKIERNKPETIISCTITSLIPASEKWENRTTKESKKVGEKQVWNEKKKKNETKDVNQEVEITKRYKIVNAEMNVSYQVKDTKSSNQLDAANIPVSFHQSYLDGNGDPGLQEVEQKLIKDVVAMITLRLTPSFEKVAVLLPQCDEFKLARGFAQSGLWQNVLQEVIKMPPLKKPQEDAYRYYSIGLANEALAYQDEALETTIKLLDDASENFTKAIELKPEEKYFREPQTRIVAAIAQYRKITEQLAEDAKRIKAKTIGTQKAELPKDVNNPSPKGQPSKVPSGTVPTAGEKGLDSSKPKSTALTNKEIIDLVKRESSDTLILQHIKSATDVQFDISTQGILELKDNKVTEPIIMAMMEKQAANKQAAPKKAPVTTRRKRNP